MDVDILKASASDSGMDMMAMMMQMEKFPELCEPFYNNTLTNPENEFPAGGASTTTTTTLPIFSIVNPNVVSPPNLINPTPPSPSSANFVHHNLFQQSMALPLQPNEVSSGRLRVHNNNNNNANSFPYTLSSDKKNSMAAMREMIFRVAVMQPIHIDPESIKPPKRRNVKISKDPQSVAARHRRERISERIRILQRLVPGGTKMDTASMLDEAIHYVKFLKKQVQTLERAGASRPINSVVGFTGLSSGNVNFSALVKGCHQPYPMVGSSASKLLS